MGSGSHIEVLRNNVHDIQQIFPGRDKPGSGGNGFGIAVYGTNAKAPITDLIIDGNEVHHLKTGSSESLVVNGNVTNFRITHNVVHDNNNIGIDVIGFERTAPDPAVDQARDGVVSHNLVYDITSRGNPAYGNDQSSDGIYVDGGTRILIEQNTIHDVDFGIELASEHKDRATSYITARNNLIYHCHTAGVSIGGYAPERGHTEHSFVINNTLYENDTSSTGSGEFQMQWNMSDDVFANNIVYAGPRCLMSLTKTEVNKTQPPVLIDHNLYYCEAGTKASLWTAVSSTIKGFESYLKSTGNDQHSRFLDPHFVDAAAHDSSAMERARVRAQPDRLCGPRSGDRQADPPRPCAPRSDRRRATRHDPGRRRTGRTGRSRARALPATTREQLDRRLRAGPFLRREGCVFAAAPAQRERDHPHRVRPQRHVHPRPVLRRVARPLQRELRRQLLHRRREGAARLRRRQAYP